MIILLLIVLRRGLASEVFSFSSCGGNSCFTNTEGRLMGTYSLPPKPPVRPFSPQMGPSYSGSPESFPENTGIGVGSTGGYTGLTARSGNTRVTGGVGGSLQNPSVGVGLKTRFAKGGSTKKKVSSASKRADGIASRGKTRGKFV